MLLLRVAQDGSGNYRTIQEAVLAVRDWSQVMVTIHIKNGVYQEKPVVPSHKPRIRLVDESQEGTIIRWGDHTGDASVRKVYQGRPWRPHSRTVYLHCEMGAHILPTG